MGASAIGAILGYFIVCIIYGKLLPALSIPVILGVAIGGTVGPFLIPILLTILHKGQPTKGNCSPPVELRCPEDGVSVECGSDGLKDGEAVLAAGIDDGADSGEEVGSPFGAEAVGDLAEDDTGT